MDNNQTEEFKDNLYEQSSTNQSTMQILDLQKTFKNGANWFYWIAGLSLLNSIIFLFGGDIAFVVGLYMTQLVDTIAYELYTEVIPELSQIIKICAFIINILLAGVYALFGLFANKRHKWSFIVGIVLYSFDTLIAIFIKDFIDVAFHGVALYGIIMDLKANKKLSELESSVQINNMNTTDTVNVTE